jgi:hypothetical protein
LACSQDSKYLSIKKNVNSFKSDIESLEIIDLDFDQSGLLRPSGVQKSLMFIRAGHVDGLHVCEGGSPDQALERILRTLLQDHVQLKQIWKNKEI